MATEPEDGVTSTLVRLLDRVMSLANGAATLWILVLMTLIVADVIGRDALLSPIAGVPEMVGFSIVVIVFLQAPHTHRHGQMIRSEGLLVAIRMRRPRLAAALDLVAQCIGVAVSVILAAAIAPRLVTAFRSGEFEGIPGHFTISVWPVLLAVTLGSVLLAASFALSAAAACRQLFRPGSR